MGGTLLDGGHLGALEGHSNFSEKVVSFVHS